METCKETIIKCPVWACKKKQQNNKSGHMNEQVWSFIFYTKFYSLKIYILPS